MPIGLGTMAATIGGSLLSHKLNQRSQDRAFEQNVEFWQNRFDQTNQYNSPVQQIARMKEAGLNPALMYGGSGSAGVPASMGSADGKKAPEYRMDNLAQISAQVQQMREDAELKKQDARLKQAQEATELQRKALTENQAKTAGALAETSMDLYRAELVTAQQKALQESIRTQVQDASKQAQINAIVSEARHRAAQAQSVENQNEIYEKVYKDLVRMGIDAQGTNNIIGILRSMFTGGKHFFDNWRD